MTWSSKRRFQEVFLFTNYEEGFFGRNSSKSGYTAEDYGKKEEPFDKEDWQNRTGIKIQDTHAIHQSILINGKQVPVKRWKCPLA